MEEKMITKEQLMRACAEAMCEDPIAEVMKDAPMLALVFALFGSIITRKLFVEGEA